MDADFTVLLCLYAANRDMDADFTVLLCLYAANRDMDADFTVLLCLYAANRDMDADFDQFDDIDDEELLSSLPLTFPFEDLQANGEGGPDPKVEEKEKEGIASRETANDIIIIMVWVFI